MPTQPGPRVAIIVVGFRNAGDIESCLRAVSRTVDAPGFDIFICENGGPDAYHDVIQTLSAANGPCVVPASPEPLPPHYAPYFRHGQRLRLRNGSTDVWVGCAPGNLGYAGGINAWLKPLMSCSAWKGLWVLNPDTEPAPTALAALIRRAECGDIAMVGSTIMEADEPTRVRMRGGIHWQELLGRGVSIGLSDPVAAPCDTSAVETVMDSPSGCSMYVTRTCIEKIGLMDDRYFLFFEDLDWGVRAKPYGLGYAADSIVVHKRGTTTGSAKSLAHIPKLSVYLEHRNGIHFVRKHFSWAVPFRVAASLLYALRFFMAGAPRNGITAIAGLLAGLRGEMGAPPWHEAASSRLSVNP